MNSGGDDSSSESSAGALSSDYSDDGDRPGGARARHRKRRKEEAIYGVFGDEFSEQQQEEPGRWVERRHGTKGARRTISGLAEPVEFVSANESSKISVVDLENSPKSENEGGRFQNLMEDASRKDQQAEAKVLRQEISSAKDTGASNRPMTRPAQLDAGFGKWEEHTKGIGSKLLAKMGFKGRLGRHESGVTRQLEVKVRPSGIGLGYGQFKEATTLRVNRQIEADRLGKNLDELEAEAESKTGGANGFRKLKEDEQREEGQWKKQQFLSRGVKRTKRQYMMAKDFIKQEDEKISSESPIVLDMRGPSVRVLNLSSAGQLSAEAAAVAAGSPGVGDEILHNVSLVLGMSEADLRSSTSRAKSEGTRKKSLEVERHQLSDEALRLGEKIVVVERMGAFVKDMTSKLTASVAAASSYSSSFREKNVIKSQDVLRAFSTLRSHCGEEFQIFRVGELILSLLVPLIELELKDWNPLADPLVAWAEIQKWRDAGLDDAFHQTTFRAMVDRTMLLSVRRRLINDWTAFEDPPEPAVQLVEIFQSFDSSLSESIVLPKLASAVASCSVDECAKGALHANILPWSVLLQDHLALLFPDVRRKLAALGSRLKPHLVRPWVGVFSPKSTEALISSAVVPSVAQALRNSCGDGGLSVELVKEKIMEWISLKVAGEYFYSLLDAEFFPKWISFLRSWLSQDDVDLALVAKWYLEWKEIFPLQCRQDFRIRVRFNRALELMQAALHGSPLPAPCPPEGGDFFEEDGYYGALQRRRRWQQQQQLHQSQKQQQSQARKDDDENDNEESGKVSFKEVVAAYAEEHGFEFLPRPGFFFEGFQTYSFGSSSSSSSLSRNSTSSSQIIIYMDGDVVYAKIDPQKDWVPVGLERLRSLVEVS